MACKTCDQVIKGALQKFAVAILAAADAPSPVLVSRANAAAADVWRQARAAWTCPECQRKHTEQKLPLFPELDS